jgi:hypothetical protein
MTKAAEVQEKEVVTVAPELAALAGEAAALDAEFGPAPEVAAPGAAAEPVVDEAAEIAAVLMLCAELVKPALPYVADIYTPEAMGRIAAAAVPVMQKYGVTMSGLFGRFGPEIGLAIAVAPVVVQTAVAHKQWKYQQALAELKRQADARQHFENTRNLAPGALSEQQNG